MFKKNLSNIVNVNSFKKKLKQLASIISCGILCYIPNISSASNNIDDITDANANPPLRIEDKIPFTIDSVQLQYMSSAMYMEATAYSPDEGGIITASGHSLYDIIGWGCASNDFPLGTQLWIECPSAPWINGTYTVLDRGGMGSGIVDIAMNNIDECYEFGRRAIYVTVIN